MTKNSIIHLFYISNYVSFNNYLSIIIKNCVPIDNCIFYSPRLTIKDLNINFKINLVEIINFKEPQNTKDKVYHFIKKSKHRKYLNKVITKNNFYFYTPHLINYREKKIISSKKCLKYFFVEEGIPAYNNNYEINYCKKFSEIKEMSNYKNKLDSVYGNHEKSFDFKIKKTYIPLSFINKYKKTPVHNIKDNDIIIGIDSYKTDVKFSNLIISYIKLLNHLKKNNINKIKLKYHPDYVAQKSYVDLFEEINLSLGFEYEIIKNNIFIEEITSKKKINLYILFSSLFLYCERNNSKVFIYNQHLVEKDKAYHKIHTLHKKIIAKLKLNIKFIDFNL